MVRVKFVTESNRKFLTLKQSGATLVFLLINFAKMLICMYMSFQNDIYTTWANFLIQGIFTW